MTQRAAFGPRPHRRNTMPNVEEHEVARVRAAEQDLNNLIRKLPRGFVVEVDSVSHSLMLDGPARQFVVLHIMKES
tara:strand:- start:3012 stop:3239 length:228 start_codon:yes stop_codon:yes gene_type:complete